MPQAGTSVARARAYRTVCEIASGGMGRVELVVHKEGDFVRLYARKRVLDGVLEPDELRSMMRDEARIAGLLRHPNVVPVHDVGEDEEGAFLVMDYVEGVPLGALVRAARARGEMVPAQVCLQVVRQAAEGLHAAHELRALDGTALELVHRDVSPSNVLIDLEGVVRVLDFGIAKAIGRRTRTSTGLLKGKIGYLAPELLRFELPDRRADLYALGVVLYELLSGVRLYAGPDVSEVARRVLHEPAPDLGDARPELPESVTELCFELMAKEREHRPASARQVAQRLDLALRELLETQAPIALSDYVAEYVDTTPILDRRRRAEILVRGADDPPPAPAAAGGASLAPAQTPSHALEASHPRPTPLQASERATAQRTPATRRVSWLRVALVLLGLALVMLGVGLGVAFAGRGAMAEEAEESAPRVSPDPPVETPAPIAAPARASELEPAPEVAPPAIDGHPRERERGGRRPARAPRQPVERAPSDDLMDF